MALLLRRPIKRHRTQHRCRPPTYFFRLLVRFDISGAVRTILLSQKILQRRNILNPGGILPICKDTLFVRGWRGSFKGQAMSSSFSKQKFDRDETLINRGDLALVGGGRLVSNAVSRPLISLQLSNGPPRWRCLTEPQHMQCCG
jgi:hypothetical protein